MHVVRVPMSRALYARVVAECVMLDRTPDVLIRDMIACAFASGDMSPLAVSNVASVASDLIKDDPEKRKR